MQGMLLQTKKQFTTTHSNEIVAESWHNVTVLNQTHSALSVMRLVAHSLHNYKSAALFQLPTDQCQHFLIRWIHAFQWEVMRSSNASRSACRTDHWPVHLCCCWLFSQQQKAAGLCSTTPLQSPSPCCCSHELYQIYTTMKKLTMSCDIGVMVTADTHRLRCRQHPTPDSRWRRLQDRLSYPNISNSWWSIPQWHSSTRLLALCRDKTDYTGCHELC